MEISLSNPLRAPRGTTAAITSRVLLDGELAYDTTLERLRVGDGATLGGVVQASEAADDARLDALEALTDNLSGPISAAMAPVVQAATTTAAIAALSAQLALILEDSVVTESDGDNVNIRWSFGDSKSTNFPGARIGGPARGGFMGAVFLAVDAGDTFDYLGQSVGGTPASPVNWTGFHPHGQYGSWSPQVAQTGGVDTTSYRSYRHFQLYGGQTETAADGAMGGWWALCTTKTGDVPPWATMYATGNGTYGACGVVFPGRSNRPGMEARLTDGGSAVPNPYNWDSDGDIQNIFSAGIVNPKDTVAEGNVHVIASDNSVPFAAIAIRFSDDLTKGFDQATDHGNDTLIFYPVVSGSRGANAIELDNAGNIRPFVTNTSTLGDSTHVFGAGWLKRLDIVTNLDGEAVLIQSTEAGAGSGPNINLYRNSASPAASDALSVVSFDGKNSAAETIAYARARGYISDPTDGSEDGIYRIEVMAAGSIVTAFETSGAGTAIRATPTNDSAAAGYVGEIIRSAVASGSAVSLTSTVAANITSISLTPGDWEVYGQLAFAAGGGTTITDLYGAINTTSATIPAPDVAPRTTLRLAFTAGASQGFGLAPYRLSLSSTTTVYLVARGDFGVSTLSGFGYIEARRVR